MFSTRDIALTGLCGSRRMKRCSATRVERAGGNGGGCLEPDPVCKHRYDLSKCAVKCRRNFGSLMMR